MSLLFASPPEQRLIPTGGVRGPVPVLIAIMMFTMVVISAAGLALGNMGSLVKTGVEHRYSIQIADGATRAPAAMAAARSAAGVARVTQVPPADLRRTIERWLGPAGAEADLPLPAIIDVDLVPGANPTALRRAIETVPGARLTAHRDSLAPLLGALSGMMLLAFTLVGLIAMATAAAVVLAARGALDTHRGTIEVMHGIGATDEQVARLFQRQIAIDALIGGLIGATAAGAVLTAALGGASVAAMTGGTPPLGLGDLFILAALPFAGALLATLVARRAVLGALRERL
ncbi:MAG: cell division protein [Sphingomonas sp.]|uniref:cell division protein FtsX n=1 Tax=Sphingomonas sp. TaxID=28214 RepID=UPI0017BFDB61|nr:cell division protein [Sphingomonas sp.]MBA3667083.1 cell division protein [Sphingomonas sp.]